MTTEISLTHESGYAYVRPLQYLGDLFAVYRDVLSRNAASFDRKKQASRVLLSRAKAVADELVTAGFVVTFDPDLTSAIEIAKRQAHERIEQAKTRAVAAEGRERGFKLYPYQRTGVQWLAPRKSAILADEPGLGKTIQALLSIPADGPALVVCPAIAIGVWQAEIARWRPDRNPVVFTRESFRAPASNEIALISYDSLPDWMNVPKGLTVIGDEAHAIKNPKAKRTINFRELTRQALTREGRVWLLTGTPLLNEPLELWHLFKAAELHALAWGTWETFLRLFHGAPAKFGGYVWGRPDETEVRERLSRFMLRRVRSEVLPDLPVKRWEDIPVAVDAGTLRECDALIRELGEDWKTLEERLDQPLVFQKMSSMAEALARAKTPALIEWVRALRDRGEVLVVFSSHRAPIEALSREGIPTITGDTPHEERRAMSESFQRGESSVIAGTIDAMGTAVTLTKSSHAIFCGLDWTPALNSQAEDRLCRIGQTRGVLISRLVATHALDRRILAVLDRKAKMLQSAGL